MVSTFGWDDNVGCGTAGVGSEDIEGTLGVKVELADERDEGVGVDLVDDGLSSSSSSSGAQR